MQDVINYALLALAVVFLVSIPLAIVGLRLREGLWGNTICLCNVSFAGFIALNYFEPLAALLGDAWAGGIFFYDFVVFWILFTISFFIINFLTNRISAIKVHFPSMVEKVGNGLMLGFIFFNFASVIAFSLPMVPLKPDEDQKANLARYSETLGLRARLLSHGTLMPFSGEREWIDADSFVNDHMNKRWALYSTALEGEGSFIYDGGPPPKRE